MGFKIFNFSDFKLLNIEDNLWDWIKTTLEKSLNQINYLNSIQLKTFKKTTNGNLVILEEIYTVKNYWKLCT